MQMQPLDDLWGTKFYTDQSHWPLLIVRPSSLLIRSNVFSKLLEIGKNKNLCYTFAFTWSTTNAYKSPRFFVLYGPTCILISVRTVIPQIVVINYQNITKGPRWFTITGEDTFLWFTCNSSTFCAPQYSDVVHRVPGCPSPVGMRCGPWRCHRLETKGRRGSADHRSHMDSVD
jgi:hypothetical protein